MTLRRKQKGQVLLLAVVLLSVVLGLSGAFIRYIGTAQKAASVFSARSAARQAALSGIDKAIWCLNQSSGTNCGGTYGFDFSGETNVSVGSNGYYTSTVATTDSSHKTITATGYYPSTSYPVATIKLKADVSVTTTGAAFHYGVQSGQGGFVLGNNANVQGNIYANGDVVGSNGAYVTGSVWVAGGTSLSPDQQQTTDDSDYDFARTSPIIDIAQSFKLSAANVVNKVSFYIKKVGSPSNATVYILADNGGVPSKTVLGTATLNASYVTTSLAWVDVSFSTPPGLSDAVTYWLAVDGTAKSSDYWVIGSQTNNGYGNGVGMYSANWNASSPTWTDAGRDYAFKIWTGGNVTKIDSTHVMQDAHANTITGSTVDGDAYYQTKTSTTVGGTSHPGSADPGPQDLPISDAQVAQWKSDAANGGTITGDVTYDGTSNSLGPKKITGNLTVTNNAVLTLTGTIWVQGTVTLNNNSVIQLTSGYGSNSGIILADGNVTINNNVTFLGSGSVDSYVIVLTDSSSLDSAAPAMNLNNNSANSIFYAGHGLIHINNNATLKEVTAFKLQLDPNASVQYESGLASVNFSSGPGGSWILQTGTVREIH